MTAEEFAALPPWKKIQTAGMDVITFAEKSESPIMAACQKHGIAPSEVYKDLTKELFNQSIGNPAVVDEAMVVQALYKMGLVNT